MTPPVRNLPAEQQRVDRFVSPRRRPEGGDRVNTSQTTARCAGGAGPSGVWFATMLVCLSGCRTGGSPGIAVVCQDLRAAEIAFLEHLYADNHSAAGTGISSVFVALPDGRKADREFLDRLDAIPVPVGPVSGSRVDGHGWVRSRASGEPALVLRITESRLTGPGRAEIRGGYEEASLSASRATYALTCESNLWQVTQVGPMMISDASISTIDDGLKRSGSAPGAERRDTVAARRSRNAS